MLVATKNTTYQLQEASNVPNCWFASYPYLLWSFRTSYMASPSNMILPSEKSAYYGYISSTSTLWPPGAHSALVQPSEHWEVAEDKRSSLFSMRRTCSSSFLSAHRRMRVRKWMGDNKLVELLSLVGHLHSFGVPMILNNLDTRPKSTLNLRMFDEQILQKQGMKNHRLDRYPCFINGAKSTTAPFLSLDWQLSTSAKMPPGRTPTQNMNGLHGEDNNHLWSRTRVWTCMNLAPCTKGTCW